MANNLVLCYLIILAFGLTWYETASMHVVTEFEPLVLPHCLLRDNEILKQNEATRKWSLVISNPQQTVTKPFRSTDVKFYLMTSKNPLASNKLELNINEKIHSNFDVHKPTRILIHGRDTGDVEHFGLEQFAAAYFPSHDVNFIYVDWSKGSTPLNYREARENVQIAGERVSELIDFLVTNGMQLKSLAMIAFSNGCHVMGFAGRTFKSKRPGNIVPKMTALDPDLIAFQSVKDSAPLAKTDAEYVEVIVTCGALLGIYKPIGHVTFYPNGGREQPGCGKDIICSHNRALDYYVESINNPHFYAIKCDDLKQMEHKNCIFDAEKPENWVMMGGEPGQTRDKIPHGVYYLETNSVKLHALGIQAAFMKSPGLLSRAMSGLNSIIPGAAKAQIVSHTHTNEHALD